jgi:ankyrin repeat protein
MGRLADNVIKTILVALTAIPLMAGSNEDSALLKAVLNNEKAKVMEAFSNGADVNAKDNRGLTAVVYASGNGNLELVKYLMGKGADLKAETTDKIGVTNALSEAIGSGNKSLVEFLLAQGMDLTSIGCKYGMWKAVGSGKTELVHFLAEKLSDPSCFNEALTRAGRDEEMLNFLLSKGADINYSGTIGNGNSAWYTALMWAAFKNDKTIAEFLITKGANVNKGDGKGNTPLGEAIISGHLAMAEFLLSKGANPSHELPLAAGSGKMEFVKLLVEHGADLNFEETDHFRDTALIQVAFYGNKGLTIYLLSKGADPNKRDVSGETALMAAKRKNRFEIVKILREAGAKE